jgi:hypothetical protein
MPDVRDVPPPEADALLWRREARAVGHDTSPVPPQRGRGHAGRMISWTSRPQVTRVPQSTHPMTPLTEF